MKPLILTATAALLLTGATYAQAQSVPDVYDDIMSLKISPEGKYVVAQDPLSLGAIIINVSTHKETDFLENYPGNGNCITDNGLLVGQTMDGSPVVMTSTGSQQILTIDGMPASGSFNAVTPSGNMACGWLFSAGEGAMYKPFYCPIMDNGRLGSPQLLPSPAKDLAGGEPQFVTAEWISDDGNTITGQVTDGTGMFTYPIVFKKINGTWDYSLPSEKLLENGDTPLPQWPEEEIYYPDVTEFMTEANAERWNEAMAAYEMDEGPNPWDDILDYMNQDYYDIYLAALKKYQEEVNEYYKKVDQYWEEMAKLINKCNFVLGSQSMNATGNLMAMVRNIPENENEVTDIAAAYEMTLFDLVSNEIRTVKSPVDFLLPTQILDDGTIIALNYEFWNDFVLLPGEDNFISFADYIASRNPKWLPWMEENLQVTLTKNDGNQEDVIINGIISFSKDGSKMAGGYNGYSGTFTYVFTDGEAGIESLAEEAPDGVLKVYDLRGVKVMETKDASEMKELPRGIYLINGKKILL